MTIEEAIERLEWLISSSFCKYSSQSYSEALEMAIAALREREGKDTNVPTNADHIRSMTDEELAKWLAYFFEATLKENGVTRVALDPAFALAALESLKQPYKEDT